MQGPKKNEVFGKNPVAIACLLTLTTHVIPITFTCQSQYLVFPNHFVYNERETERVR